MQTGVLAEQRLRVRAREATAITAIVTASHIYFDDVPGRVNLENIVKAATSRHRTSGHGAVRGSKSYEVALCRELDCWPTCRLHKATTFAERQTQASRSHSGRV